MYRLMLYVLGAIAIMAGLLIGALNSEKVPLDLLWLQLEWPLGVVLVLAFAAGLLLGTTVVYLLLVIPLRISLRRNKAAVLAEKEGSQALAKHDA